MGALPMIKRDAITECKAICDQIYKQSQRAGFTRDLVTGYNVLLSAARYLELGSPLPGSRCEKFFAKGAL